MGHGLETRLSVLEALFTERGITQARALSEAKAGIDARLHDMNGWRAEEIATKPEPLRAEVYDKSEDLHRAERETLAARISTLEIRITQVATVGAIAVLLATILSPLIYHWLAR